MKLTRSQELILIDRGLKSLLESLVEKRVVKKNPVDKKGKYSLRWSTERRKKFSETMKKKWARGDYKNKKK